MKSLKSLQSITACAISILCFSKIATPGFEIGNARKVIENLPGKYTLVVPEKSEVGLAHHYTEVTTPLSAGTPRTRLQVNLVTEANLNSLADLIDSRKEKNWSGISLSGMQGIRKEVTVPTGLRQVEVRLFLKPGKIVVINLEGVPSASPLSSFETLKEAIDTFKLNTIP